MSNASYTPKRALVIMAHPDDIEFSCSGTVARWVRAGAQVAYVLVTSGDVGIAEPGMTRARATEIREEEQRAAAAVVGVHDVRFLREPDGMVEATMALRKKLVREIRRFKPDVVICGDPQILWAGDGYINHPDHRAVALAAVDAIFPAAGQPNLFEELADEGLSAHKPYKVYVSAWEKLDTYVNISDVIDLKIESLRAHKSQMKDWDPEERVRSWSAETAKGKEMDYAEGFRVVTFSDAAPEKKEEAAAQPAQETPVVPEPVA